MTEQGLKKMLEKLEARMESFSRRMEASGVLQKKLASVPKRKLAEEPPNRLQRKLACERMGL